MSRTALLLSLALTAPANAQVPAGNDSPAAVHDEVRIPTGAPGVTLAGTLSRPRTHGLPVTVLFLTGSGDHTRDQVISGTPMFADISRDLLRSGYTTLRLDDRGTGASTGPTTTASTTNDRVDDMAAAVQWLARTLPGHRVVLLGHSEGAMVAAAVAGRETAVSGLILLGAPARPGRVVWIDQQMAGIAAHLKQDVEELHDVRTLLQDVVRQSVSGGDEAAIEETGVALFRRIGLDLDEARRDGMLAGFVERISSPWFRHFLAHDPTADYRLVRVPTLAVYGGIDHLTSPTLNAPPLEAAIVGANLTVEVLPEQDHFFLRSPDLPPGQHRFRQMHVAPELLELLQSWLLKHFDTRQPQ